MKQFYVIILLVFFCFTGLSQNVEPIVINKNKAPLNIVLLELREKHQLNFAYNEALVAQYKITMSDTFWIAENAIEALLKHTTLNFEETDGVFVIYPQKKGAKKKEQSKLIVKGLVLDAFTKEPLPFSHIQINNHAVVSDIKGSFVYAANVDTLLRLRASHLGYFIEDTLITGNAFCQFNLVPATEKLKEILITSNPIQKATLIGEYAGKMKVNHNISRFMPGNGDNSVYNLLRVLPGIQAAGEQSSDLLIWGSYAGQSQISFDGFTLFGLKNYNDNIGVMNPLVVKNIEVHKGGYDARMGNRVGGVVEIIGKNGNTQKTTLELNISNTFINGMVEIPLFNKQSSLLLAHRRTYYNLYNSDDFNIFNLFNSKGNSNSQSTNNLDTELNVYPQDYSFHDTNIKYTFRFKNGNLFYVSLYGGNDNFDLLVEKESVLRNIWERKWVYNNKEKKYQWRNVKTEYEGNIQFNDADENKQRGASVYYDLNWKNGNNSNITVSHSGLDRYAVQKTGYEIPAIDSINLRERNWIANEVVENSIRNENTLNFDKGHQLQFGVGSYSYKTLYNFRRAVTDSLGVKDTLDEGYNQEAGRVYAYVQDILPLSDNVTVKAGFRINYTFPENRFYLEPRLSFNGNFDPLKLSISWSRHKQFLSKTEYVDNLNNYYYYWITHNDNFPVITSDQLIGGISYNRNSFTCNLDAYYKSSNGMIRSRYTPTLNANKRYEIDGKSYGFDLYLKKEFDRLSIWGSYTYGKALEVENRLDRTEEPGDFMPAPQDQRHEAKGAVIYQLGSIYLSANYVYGSGIQLIKEVLNESLSDVSYHRMDAAVLYKFNHGRFNAEIGFSVLNVLNTQNFKYSNIKRIRFNVNQNLLVYANAVPFTPTLHFKLRW